MTLSACLHCLHVRNPKESFRPWVFEQWMDVWSCLYLVLDGSAVIPILRTGKVQLHFPFVLVRRVYRGDSLA
jgi:hypothetical protein